LSVDWRSGLSGVGRATRQNQNTALQESNESGITGTVISSGVSVCIDNGIDFVTLEKGFNDMIMDVGDEVRAVGIKTNDKLAAKSVSKMPEDFAVRKLPAIKRRLKALESAIQSDD
jgi:hypothetical protein